MLEAAGATELFARRVVQEDVGNAEMKPHPTPPRPLPPRAGPRRRQWAVRRRIEDSATGVKSVVSPFQPVVKSNSFGSMSDTQRPNRLLV